MTQLITWIITNQTQRDCIETFDVAIDMKSSRRPWQACTRQWLYSLPQLTNSHLHRPSGLAGKSNLVVPNSEQARKALSGACGALYTIKYAAVKPYIAWLGHCSCGSASAALGRVSLIGIQQQQMAGATWSTPNPARSEPLNSAGFSQKSLKILEQSWWKSLFAQAVLLACQKASKHPAYMSYKYSSLLPHYPHLMVHRLGGCKPGKSSSGRAKLRTSTREAL